MDDLITSEIWEQNPWWSNPTAVAEGTGKPRRDVWKTVWTRVTERELITALVGLRRVGKTTLVRQVIDDLLKSGVKGGEIMYFSCENLDGKRAAESLRQLVKVMAGRSKDKKKYLFIDEIQYVDGWNVVLKKYFDLYPELKFTVTGSASLFIGTKARESLAGRIQEVIVQPMGFGEYLRVSKGIKVGEPVESFDQVLRENFSAYLAWGEFPYLEKLPGWEEKREYVADFVVKKVVEMDLPRLKKIYGSDISRLVNIILASSGQLVEMQNLGGDLGMAKNTLREYLGLLEQTYLVGQAFNFGIGYRTRSTRQRKIYCGSTNAVVLASGLNLQPEVWQAGAGRFVENFVFNYLVRKGSGEVGFWRERQVREVDFVVVGAEGKLPVEVKYQSQIRFEDLKNLLYFCKKERLKRAEVVTKEKWGLERMDGVEVKFTPAHFLV